MNAKGIPKWLSHLIASPPQHGNGLHFWLFKVARQLHAHCSEEDIVALLTAASEGCGRHVPEREIREAVADAGKVAWKPAGGARPLSPVRAVPKWPDLDPKTRAKVIASSEITGVADLWDASPMTCTLDSTDAEFFADQLFPGNPLLCVGWDNRDFATAPRESLRGSLSSMSMIVPSPMSGSTGRRKSDGKESAHTLDNTGSRHYLVTEFDDGTADEQAAIIGHLSQFAPLVLVLSSGGKSLHAWWKCRGIGEDVTGRFMRYAVMLGADRATWTRSQFVRLPQGWRADKDRRQEVYFFNHSKAEGAPS